MSTGDDYVAWLDQHFGVPYSTSGRFGPDFYDCSGFCAVGYREVVGHYPQCGLVSSEMARFCYDAGGEISVDQAVNEPPGTCWAFEGPDRGLQGFGDAGHIVVVVGRSTRETPAWGRWGHASGIGAYPRGGFTGAGRIPGIHPLLGGAGAQPVEKPRPRPRAKETDMLIAQTNGFNYLIGETFVDVVNDETAFDLAGQGFPHTNKMSQEDVDRIMRNIASRNPTAIESALQIDSALVNNPPRAGV